MRGRGSQERTRHPHSMLTHKTSNHALQRPLFGTGGRPLISLNYEIRRWHPEVTAPQKQAGVQTGAYYCVTLPTRASH